MNLDTFMSWLIDRNKMKAKSARDVLSRYKRAQKYIEDNNKTKIEETIFFMDQNDDFKKLSLFVRSQLRRAIKLHDDFIKQKPSK
jgi:hypothetical protein